MESMSTARHNQILTLLATVGLMPLNVFRRRNLSVANLMAGLSIAIASLLAFILTLYLQGVLGFTPMATGLAFLPAGLGGIAGGQLAARGAFHFFARRREVVKYRKTSGERREHESQEEQTGAQ